MNNITVSAYNFYYNHPKDCVLTLRFILKMSDYFTVAIHMECSEIHKSLNIYTLYNWYITCVILADESTATLISI